jgi:hypothetical protein
MRPWKAGMPHSLPKTNTQCEVCSNLYFKDSVAARKGVDSETQGTTNSRDELPSSSKRRLRLNVFDLAESADAGDCLWCSLIYRSLIEVGAQLPEPGTQGTATIIANMGKPFYVEWTTVQQRIAAEIYQSPGQHTP